MASAKLSSTGSTILAKKYGRVHPSHLDLGEDLEPAPPLPPQFADGFVRRIQEKMKSHGISPPTDCQSGEGPSNSTEHRASSDVARRSTVLTSNGSQRTRESLERPLQRMTDQRFGVDGRFNLSSPDNNSRDADEDDGPPPRHPDDGVDEEEGSLPNPPSDYDKDYSMRWRQQSYLISFCCSIVLVLLFAVIVLSVKLANKSVRPPASYNANGASVGIISHHSMHANFDELLFSASHCNGCRLQIAIDNTSAIVSTNHSVHFFLLQNDDWKEDGTFEIDVTSNDDMPVAISGDDAVVGVPNDIGSALVFERDMKTWNKREVLEKGWDNADWKDLAGIVSNFGTTVAVDKGIIGIGAHAKIGNIVPAFFFKKGHFGWIRQDLSPPYSDRQTKANQISVRNGLALVALSDPYPGVRDGSVFIFQKNSSDVMSRVQKIEDRECTIFGTLVAAILDDEGIVVSCVNDDDAIELHFYTKTSAGSYLFDQKIALRAFSNDVPAGWFAVDATSPNSFALIIDGTVQFFHQSNGTWREATLTLPGSYYGSVAISGDKLLLGRKDDVAAFTLESKSF